MLMFYTFGVHVTDPGAAQAVLPAGMTLGGFGVWEYRIPTAAGIEINKNAAYAAINWTPKRGEEGKRYRVCVTATVYNSTAMRERYASNESCTRSLNHPCMLHGCDCVTNCFGLILLVGNVARLTLLHWLSFSCWGINVALCQYCVPGSATLRSVALEFQTSWLQLWGVNSQPITER